MSVSHPFDDRGQPGGSYQLNILQPTEDNREALDS